jgi:phosphoribosylformylglycinamidine synthase
MGEEIGAEVWLDKAPLKYDGLSYTEIWISEAQERMVLAVPPETWDEFHALWLASEGVEATILGQFVPTGRLVLKYHGEVVGDMAMSFLHEGRPPIVREAIYEPRPERPLALRRGRFECRSDCERHGGGRRQRGDIDADPVVAECRQQGVDHSAVRPRGPGRQRDQAVGWVANDGPSDAAVVRPVLGLRRGSVIACGMNPRFGDLDPYHMAAGAIDEAVRNCVAVGADPSRIAILDNFCWGYTDRPEHAGAFGASGTGLL